MLIKPHSFVYYLSTCKSQDLRNSVDRYVCDERVVFVAVPGGSVSMDGETPKTNICIFSANEDMESMRNFEQVPSHHPPLPRLYLSSSHDGAAEFTFYLTFANDEKHG